MQMKSSQERPTGDLEDFDLRKELLINILELYEQESSKSILIIMILYKLKTILKMRVKNLLGAQIIFIL